MIDVLVDALAAYRLTRLARTDTITLRWRDTVEARSVVVQPKTGYVSSLCECGHGLTAHIYEKDAYGNMTGQWRCLPLPRVLRDGESPRPRCDCTVYRQVPHPTECVDVQPYAFMRDALDCGWCTSVWATGVTLLLPRWARRALAIAALAGIVSQYLETYREEEL